MISNAHFWNAGARSFHPICLIHLLELKKIYPLWRIFPFKPLHFVLYSIHNPSILYYRVLRSTIEIPIRVLINGLSSFSTYHPNIICNSRRQIDIKLIFCSLSKMYNILLSFQTLNEIVSIFGQIFVNQYKYEASYCQQLFNLLHWNVMTDHKNDNIGQLFYSLHKCAKLLWNLHRLIASTSLATSPNSFPCFYFFPSP